MLVFASICPHPPIIIPTIGGRKLNKVKKTVKAMEKLAKDFVLTAPQTTLVISPHGPMHYNKMTIVNSQQLSGSFYNFGDLETELTLDNDLEIIGMIKTKSEEENIAIECIDKPNLDHGTLVPLYYLAKNYSSSKAVPIAFSYLNFQTHFKFGQIIGDQLTKNNKKYAVVASGDLSHRITPRAPAGYSPRGKEFDEKLIDLLTKNDVEAILNLDQDLIEEAGECGLRSIIILLGILSTLKYKIKVLSYEAPFGVGYLVAHIEI